MSGQANREEVNSLLDNLFEAHSNKKVLNAKKHTYDGIEFKSGIEVSCYKLLKEANIPFEYEGLTFSVFPDFRLDKVNYFHQMSPKDKRYMQYFTKKGEKLKMSHVTITPDFRVLLDGYMILIETKGKANDVYPYKRKLLLHLLETSPNSKKFKGIYFFEPRGVKQIKESIRIIKEIFNEESKQNRATPEKDITES